jgi:hypothetical protein
MIQDMFEPEYYLSRYETKDTEDGTKVYQDAKHSSESCGLIGIRHLKNTRRTSMFFNEGPLQLEMSKFSLYL